MIYITTTTIIYSWHSINKCVNVIDGWGWAMSLWRHRLWLICWAENHPAVDIAYFITIRWLIYIYIYIAEHFSSDFRRPPNFRRRLRSFARRRSSARPRHVPIRQVNARNIRSVDSRSRYNTSTSHGDLYIAIEPRGHVKRTRSCSICFDSFRYVDETIICVAETCVVLDVQLAIYDAYSSRIRIFNWKTSVQLNAVYSLRLL